MTPNLASDSAGLSTSSLQETNEYAIDCIETQNTLLILSDYIKEGKIDESTRVLDDLLAVNAKDGNAVVFRRILDILTSENTCDTASLLKQVALRYASYGSPDIAKEVLPFLDPVEVLQLERDIEGVAKTYSPQVTATVFEDISDDYVTPSPLPARHPSVMEQIEQTLPAVLPASSNGSVFEDVGDEYMDHSPTSYIPHSTDVFHQLVVDQDYQNAFQLLRALQDLHIPIPPSLLYETAAHAALTNHEHPVHVRTERFLAWMSLIPARHELQDNYRFSAVRRLVFHPTIINANLCINFSLLMAHKGYQHLVAQEVIPLIVQFTPEWKPFADTFVRAAEGYLQQHQATLVAERVAQLKQSVYTLAIRNLFDAGKYEDGISLVPEDPQVSFRLARPTFNKMLRYLQRPSVRDTQGCIQHVLRLQSIHLGPTPPDLPHPAYSSHTLPPEGLDLLSAVKYLKHAVLNDYTIPSASVVVDILLAYLNTGRHKAWTYLVNKAIRNCRAAAQQLLLAEMLLYRRLGHYDLVLQTYYTHFYFLNVPRDLILSYAPKTSDHSTPRTVDSNEDRRPTRIYQLDLSAVPPRKTLPTRAHTNLVWDALANLARTDEELEGLYARLVAQLRDGSDPTVNPILDGVPVLFAPPYWDEKPSHGAFTPFLRRIAKRKGPERAEEILSDMVSLGISPTIQHYTEVAGSYATLGHAEDAFRIVDMLEGAARQGGYGDGAGLPHPDRVFFRSIIRGFVKARRPGSARKALRKLGGYGPYTKGRDLILDKIVADLHALEAVKRSGRSRCKAD